MTPEDVKRQIEELRFFASTVELRSEHLKRIYAWEFNTFHDEANYKVGNLRFWFKIIENGWVRVGYEERFTAGGFGGGLTSKHRYDAFKNIKTLQQIDILFGMMSEEYR